MYNLCNYWRLWVQIVNFPLLQLITVYKLVREVFLELCFRCTKVFPAKLLNPGLTNKSISKGSLKVRRIVINGNPTFLQQLIRFVTWKLLFINFCLLFNNLLSFSFKFYSPFWWIHPPRELVKVSPGEFPW